MLSVYNQSEFMSLFMVYDLLIGPAFIFENWS